MISSVEKIYVDGNFDNIYRVTFSDGKISNVPIEDNTDYQEIMEYIENGGTVIDNPPEETP